MSPAALPAEWVPATAFGLPTHALVLHAAVVVLPLASLLLLACAFSDAARRRAGLLLPAAGVLSLALVPLATESGEALAARLGAQAAVAAHAEAGEAVLPWAAGLALASVALWWVSARARHRLPTEAATPHTGPPVRRRWRSLPATSAASVLLAVAAVTAAVGTTATVVRAGHLGATATWGYVDELPTTPGG